MTACIHCITLTYVYGLSTSNSRRAAAFRCLQLHFLYVYISVYMSDLRSLRRPEGQLNSLRSTPTEQISAFRRSTLHPPVQRPVCGLADAAAAHSSGNL